MVGDYLDAGIGDISGMLPEIWVRGDDLKRAKKVLERLENSQKASRPDQGEE